MSRRVTEHRGVLAAAGPAGLKAYELAKRANMATAVSFTIVPFVTAAEIGRLVIHLRPRPALSARATATGAPPATGTPWPAI